MTAPLSGGWKRRFVALTDPPNNPLHTADPAHLGDSTQPEANAFVWTDPATVPADAGPDPSMVDYLSGLDYVIGSPGEWYDHTPTDSAVGYAGSADPGPLGDQWYPEAANRAEAGQAHSTSYGADIQSNRGNAATLNPVDQVDEQYINPRFESDRAVQLNPAVAVRGFNGQATNSDESLIRPGFVDQSFVMRRMLAPAIRVHDDRIYTVNTAAIPVDQPPVASPYGSPFSRLARAMTRTWQRPMIRRDPPPIDEQLVTDGIADVYHDDADSGAEYVVG